MNSQRNKSKSGRRTGPWCSVQGETKAQRLARLHATKKASKRRKLKAKYAKVKLTPELKAEVVAKLRNSVLRVVETWLSKPETVKLLLSKAERSPWIAYNSVPWMVRETLNDLLPKSKEE